VQALVDLVEDWRSCKRLIIRNQNAKGEANKGSHSKSSIKSANKKHEMIEEVAKVIRDYLSEDARLMKSEDIYGIKAIPSMAHFNK
jgi:hypothetical protein